MANDTDAVELAAELTMAWLRNPHTRVDATDVPAFLRSMHQAVSSLDQPAAAGTDASSADAAKTYEPAVSVRKSLASKDHIISLIDGKLYKTLRRHLSGHGLTPDDYRARYGLKPDYPMVSENYSEARRSMAHKIGLGRKPKEETTAAEAKPAKASRKSVADAKKAAKAHLEGQ